MDVSLGRHRGGSWSVTYAFGGGKHRDAAAKIVNVLEYRQDQRHPPCHRWHHPAQKGHSGALHSSADDHRPPQRQQNVANRVAYAVAECRHRAFCNLLDRGERRGRSPRAGALRRAGSRVHAEQPCLPASSLTGAASTVTTTADDQARCRSLMPRTKSRSGDEPDDGHEAG